MYKFTFLISIIFICLNLIECGPTGSTGSSYGNRYAGSRNRLIAAAPPPVPTTPAPMTGKEFLQTQGTFQAWSLILVIIVVIIAGLAIYYAILCYPFLCRTESNYQFMDASSTITGTTSRSIPSIGNFPPNGKSIDRQYQEKSINDYINSETGIAQLEPKTLELK